MMPMFRGPLQTGGGISGSMPQASPLSSFAGPSVAAVAPAAAPMRASVGMGMPAPAPSPVAPFAGGFGSLGAVTGTTGGRPMPTPMVRSPMQRL